MDDVVSQMRMGIKVVVGAVAIDTIINQSLKARVSVKSQSIYIYSTIYSSSFRGYIHTYHIWCGIDKCEQGARTLKAQSNSNLPESPISLALSVSFAFVFFVILLFFGFSLDLFFWIRRKMYIHCDNNNNNGSDMDVILQK